MVLRGEQEYSEPQPHDEQDEDEEAAVAQGQVDYDQNEGYDEADNDREMESCHGAGRLDVLVRLKVSGCVSAAKEGPMSTSAPFPPTEPTAAPKGHARRLDCASKCDEMQLYQPRPPRGVTIGIAAELLGIAFAIFGLAASDTSVAGGQFWSPNPTIAGIATLVAFIGLIMHTAGWRICMGLPRPRAASLSTCGPCGGEASSRIGRIPRNGSWSWRARSYALRAIGKGGRAARPGEDAAPRWGAWAWAV